MPKLSRYFLRAALAEDKLMKLQVVCWKSYYSIGATLDNHKTQLPVAGLCYGLNCQNAQQHDFQLWLLLMAHFFFLQRLVPFKELDIL